VRRGDQRDFLSLRIAVLCAVEVGGHGGRTAPGLPSRFGKQPADHGRSLACNVPKSILVARLILAWDESEITPDCLGASKPMGIVDEGGHGFCSAYAHTWNAPQRKH
jgi:hypothetical protein